jgi:hypothetical protein
MILAAGLFAAVLALSSCVGFPQAAGEDSSLVIGSLILDFPDGFIDLPPRKLDLNVRLSFRNVTQSTRFYVYTKRGYFYFQANGGDRYLLESFDILNTTIDETFYFFPAQAVDLEIDSAPGEVLYLGDVLVTYSDPQVSRRGGFPGRTTHYEYETSAAVEWNRELLRQYIRKRRKGSAWLELEPVEYERNRPALWGHGTSTEYRARRNSLLQM